MANTDARYLIRDYGPMVLFASITIGGMIFIWSSKLMGWSLPIVTGVPLVLMGIYFIVSLAVAGFRLHNEQAGDNLYYMGFLFTLSSLGVSLYLFAGETSIETIVRNFGIAVTSTIAGVTLRILFNQMRRDPIDIERSVRHELAEMTRRVRSELDSSSREFSHYRRVSNQMLSEGFEEIARQAERNGPGDQQDPGIAGKAGRDTDQRRRRAADGHDLAAVGDNRHVRHRRRECRQEARGDPRARGCRARRAGTGDCRHQGDVGGAIAAAAQYRAGARSCGRSDGANAAAEARWRYRC